MLPPRRALRSWVYKPKSSCELLSICNTFWHNTISSKFSATGKCCIYTTMTKAVGPYVEGFPQHMFPCVQLTILSQRGWLASRLFRLLGGGQATLRPCKSSMRLTPLSARTYLIVDGCITKLNKTVRRRAEEHGIRSWQWLKDCIVSGRVVTSG